MLPHPKQISKILSCFALKDTEAPGYAASPRSHGVNSGAGVLTQAVLLWTLLLTVKMYFFLCMFLSESWAPGR